MGLAVLPARLKQEMEELKRAILEKQTIHENELLKKHAHWVEEFIPKYKKINDETIDTILEEEIGLVFLQVLEDAGVFKRTSNGKEAFHRFINILP